MRKLLLCCLTFITCYSTQHTFGQNSINGDQSIKSPIITSSVGNVRSMEKIGNYLYVGLWNSSNILVYDISNAGTPTLINTQSIETSPITCSLLGMTSANGYLYVVSRYTDKLYIIDVSDPLNLVVTGTLALPVNNEDIVVDGNFAYIATVDSNGPLTIVDISNPASPTMVSTTSFGVGAGPYYSFQVAKSGNFVYLNYLNNGGITEIKVIDVTTPSTPTLATTLNVPGNSFGGDFEVVGTTLYLSYSFNGTYYLRAYDISIPSAPVFANDIVIAGYANSLNYDGQYLYLGCITSTSSSQIQGGLTIVDISTPLNPVVIAESEAGYVTPIEDIAVVAGYCYVANSYMYNLLTFPLGCSIDQTVTATDTELCPTNSGTTITTSSSEIGIDYYLRDNANDTIVDGPITGTGSGLTFNTSTLSSTMTYNVLAKNEGKALDFDGVDDYITADTLLSLSNNFTYEAWVNPTSTITLNFQATSGITGTTGQRYLVYPQHGGVAYGSSNDAGVGISVGTNGVSVFEHTDGYLPALLVHPTTISGWTHIAVVCTNKQYTLYINGVLVKTGLTSLKTNVHPNIGESKSGQNSGIGGGDYGYFQGSIDEFRLWDYPRTATEIQSTLNSCITATETGLVAVYDFEKVMNDTITTDKSTNNFNSALRNMDFATDWITGTAICSCSMEMTITPTVTVQDTIAPVADSTSLPNLTDQCSVTPTAPTATDNCSGTITGTTTTTFPITTQGSTTITWTFDDGNGNTSTQTQNVVINDTIAPVADSTTLSNVTSQCSVTMPTAPTATDNCSGTITGTTTTSFPITAQGSTVVTWTFDDGNGNTSTQDQNVIINDTIAPVEDVATLSDITATCEVTSLTDPTATDNCNGTVTVTNDATLPINTIGTTVVTWTYDDGNGNTSTQTQNVVISGVDVTTITTGLTISANNTTATAYQWVDCNNNTPISGETNATYTATANGDYAVIITEGNCSDTSTCVNINNVGINELSDLGVSIYPNPNNGEFTISTTENNVRLTIYSADGKVIINNLKVTQANQLINLGDVETGVYFVKVMNETNQKTIRLVIE